MSIPDEAMTSTSGCCSGTRGGRTGLPTRPSASWGGVRRPFPRRGGPGTGAEAAFRPGVRRAWRPPTTCPTIDLADYLGESDGEIHLPAADRGLVRDQLERGAPPLDRRGVKLDGNHWVPTRWTSRPRHWAERFYRSGSGASQNFTARLDRVARKRYIPSPSGAPGVEPRRLREASPVSEAQWSLKTEQRASPWAKAIWRYGNVQARPIRCASVPDGHK